MSDYLLPIADREPLAWILDEQRTAFTAARERAARGLRPGDRLFLHATRGCFHNPTRNRGRVLGRAEIVSAPAPLERPAVFGGREFPLGVELRIETLARRGTGVELAPLVERLHVFPDLRSWSARMRRALVPPDAHDSPLIARAKPGSAALSGRTH